MKTHPEICSLDYLVGTLSTAYMGVITSLAMKDFCMTEEGKGIRVSGTVLSMPPGEYEASLIEKGIELARTRLEQGSFKLETEGERVRQARELQIDIIQNGRHIGTFLLKKDGGAGGIYISAVELSAELKGMDFKPLTVPLRNRIGLLRRAEEIITMILSTKKDWADFSVKLHSFTEDFFWSARRGFYGAFPILAHFSLKAAEQGDTALTAKPVIDFLDSIALPLREDADHTAVRGAVGVWLNELNASAMDLSAHAGRAAAVFALLYQRFPDIDLAPVLAHLLESIQKKLPHMPSLSASTLAPLESRLDREDYARIAVYDRRARDELFRELSEIEAALGQGRTGQTLAFLSRFDPEVLDPGAMITRFYETIANRLSLDSADAFSAALEEAFSLVPAFPVPAGENVASAIGLILQKLVSIGRSALCKSLLDATERAGSPLKEAVFMNQATARAVLGSGNSELVSGYTALLNAILIPSPRVREISAETWAVVVNPLHLERLTKFMDILQLGDDRLRDVLIHAIANLSITGVFVPDDRLYQRKISAYLNSAALNFDFLLNYLLLQELPVYFNEVGAVSAIRDYSTEIDAWGNDPVLYFIRKQVHVNASNHNVRLIEKVVRSWVFNDPEILQTSIPRDVYANLKPELFERYSKFIRPFFESIGILSGDRLHVEKLLAVPEEEFRSAGPDERIDEIRHKVLLLCRLYREIVKKYSFAGNRSAPDDDVEALRRYLENMKNLVQTVLAAEKTSPRESLYFKRHIAFGIPSVLGTYHEKKFDALGEFLRNGAAFRVFFENSATEMDARRKSNKEREVGSWLHMLPFAFELLALHGLKNMHLEEMVLTMEQNPLYLSQVSDLLKMCQKELSWMVSFFNRTFQKPVTDILRKFPEEDLPELLMHLDRTDPDFLNQAADIVIRDIIAGLPGMMETDRMIERLLRLIEKRIEKGIDDRINEHLTEEERPYLDLYALSDAEAIRVSPLIGNKAKNVVFLYNRGFPVPVSVVLSSKLAAASQNEARAPEFKMLLRDALQPIENKTGMFFGDARNPLFLSVRSGSYISMPGILDTVLYCGINRETLQGFIEATGDQALAWDSYRRFIEHYATTVLGLDMRMFDRIRNEFLHNSGLAEPNVLTAANGESLVARYQREIAGRGMSIPGDVHEQLRHSVRAIYASWTGARAELFRKATKVSVHWGTSVTLMQMVYGNAAGAGASVFFTRNPFNQDREIHGETREMATGDDLVYGRHSNRPLSKKQARSGKHESQKSLEEIDPELFDLHQNLARDIEQAMGGLPQEAEVTYVTRPDGRRTIFVLQTRRMEFSAARAAQFDEICEMESRIIARGIGAHGGALSGVASFARSAREAARLQRETGMPVILLRSTANTGDVSVMPAIRGIVTSAGGVTSHAAVLAQKFDINAVVGCSGMSIRTSAQGEPYAIFDGTTVKEGSLISLDGSSGLVFSGLCLNIAGK